MGTDSPLAGKGAPHGHAAGAAAFRPDFLHTDLDQSDPITSLPPIQWASIFSVGAGVATELAQVAPAQLSLATPGFVLGNYWPVVTNAASVSSAAATASRMTDDNSDVAVRGPQARSLYGVSGAGIRIGILSDSFNVLGGMAADEADGNLPANVTILKEGPAGSHDEGRAMADLVHKIAPGAQIDFYNATEGETTFAAGIAALQAAGCNVIVDDVAYLDEPFFQDGSVVQKAVENAVAHGVSYFTAASNEGNNYIQRTFAGVHTTLPGLPPGVLVQNFATNGGSQPWENVTIPVGGQIDLDMQWDQPFADIGSGHSSANSLGLALYSQSGQLLAAASTNCVGGNPDQTLSFTNTTGATGFRLVVYLNGGSTPPNLFKIINYGSGTLSGGGTGTGTVIGQEMVPGANTVGAMAWYSTAAYGGGNTVESYSSVGTGDIIFNAAGQRLAVAQSTAKVNFAAPDGSVTSVYAPFYGTSAAAPNAAAVAALMLQADPRLSPAQVTSIMEETAAKSSGGSLAAGAGLVQADAAVKLALQMAHQTGG